MVDTPEEQRKMEAVVEKVRKLLNLAAKNTNAEEAASATAKAQELLSAYNLDMAVLEQGGAESGAREEARVKGGMYVYERELWAAIAHMNFCFYFTTRENQQRGNRRWLQFKHRVIGRVVNTTATKVMGAYIQNTIERLCRERFPVNSQFFCTEAVAYREGMADAVMSKLRERRREIERGEEKKKKAAEAAAKKSGADTRFALTLSDVKKSEHEANYDFIHGEGAWKRKKEREERLHAEWDRERAEEARAEAEADAAYARWAAANPEEAAAEERKRINAEKKKERDAARRRANGSGWGRYRAPSAREKRQSSSYFEAGEERGRGISIDPQMNAGAGDAKRIGRN